MKKLSFSVFVLLVCLLFINTQPQFAADFSKAKSFSMKGKKVEKNNKSTINGNKISGKKKFSEKNVQKQVSLWQQVSEELLKSESYGLPDAEKYLVFRLNKTSLSELLADVPSEAKKVLPEKPVVMELPMPDGSFARFRIEESSVLEPDLAARFPEIKSYRGQGIDDPTLTTRFDWTSQGFHALILSDGQTINLEPANVGDASLYISYYGDDLKKGEYSCLVKDFQKITPELPQTDAPEVAVGSTLRSFRIAIATDYEYTSAYGNGTVAGTITSLNTWLNGANLIYERELSIHLNLVNNTSIIYTTPDDPYDNNDVINMLFAVTNDLNDKVGQTNYDIGHVMGYLPGGASGVAFVGVACLNNGGGATLMGGSVGNSSALGVWVHELGHEFGADHNYNGTQGNCGPSRSNEMSYESGSGSTIMGYPQICGSDNIAYSRDMRFHAMSYAAINSYLASYGTCAVKTATGNTAPVVSGGGNFTIPKNTPFTLTATASDANGDNLTYNWEQIDAGGSSYPQNGTTPSYNDAGDPSTTTRPIFRPYQSSTSPSRNFPNLFYVINFANDPPDTDSYGQQTADELPRIARTLNFRVTARDNRSGGGGVNEDTVKVTVSSSGPFLVTSPNSNTNLSGGTAQNVTWSVNNTNVAPVNATNVKISLSTDGGLTFPTVLAANTPNDGSESVVFPNITSNTARIKVESVGNIFFDISNTDFSITAGTVGSQGFEADVAPRPNGSGSVNGTNPVTSSDVSQLTRFQLGLDADYMSNEFQRADCAPSSTRGNGVVSSTDVSQATRYQLGLDAPQAAGGPTAPSSNRANVLDFAVGSKANLTKLNKAVLLPRVVRVVNTNATAGSNVSVTLQVDAQGDESVYGFSLNYDPTKLTLQSITNGAATTGALVGTNPNNPGEIGFSVNYGNATIQAGNNQTFFTIQFRVAANAQAGSTSVFFDDTPTVREVSNTQAQPVATTFADGTVTIVGPTAAAAAVGGRVVGQRSRGVANAQVVMTNSLGERRVSRTNGFGYFRIAEVAAGETYTVTVKSKHYRFTAKVISVTQDVDDLFFTALP